MAVSDLTGTTWVFNQSITGIDGNFQIDCISDDFDIHNIWVYEDNYVEYVGGFPPESIIAYSVVLYGGWAKEAYRTISITGGMDVANATLIAWLEANAVQQGGGGGGSLKVTYNGSDIVDTTTSGTFTLSCAGKMMSSNVVIAATDVTSVSATYNNATIVNGTGTHTYTLSCNGMYMATDVGISVTIGGAVVYPVKGDIINIDMNGDGTAESYLVLKVSGSVCEVLLRTAYTNNTFAPSGSDIYAGGGLDNRLNNTWYNTCSATAKAAIVDKTFRQDKWYMSSGGSPVYYGTYQTSSQYTISLNTASYGSEITRHAYALSVQDIIDYLEVTPQMTSSNSTLNRANIRAMFNNSSNSVWTRSARVVSSGVGAVIANCSTGRIAAGAVTSSYQARPVFQIDLSKIDWSKA